MKPQNKGYDNQVIAEYKEKMGSNKFLIIESEDNSDEYVNFLFIGSYEGKQVVIDAVIYTLRLNHHSELYEMAEHKAAKAFPEFKKIDYHEDENGDMSHLNDIDEEIGLFMTEVMIELEEEGAIKVKEHIEIDSNVDFGIGMDIGLNRTKIDDQEISKFVTNYNNNTFKLDKTLYTFKTEEEETEG